MEPSNQPVNASEPWILYDTVQIRQQTKSNPIPNASGFATLADLANAQSVNMFNVRAVGDPGVGEAYNNFDSRDSMPFAFVLKTLGITFQSPRGLNMKPTYDLQNNIAGMNAALIAMWEQELPRHVGVHFKVSQDEKLLTSGMFLPEGTGLAGFGVSGPVLGAIGASAPVGGAVFASGAAQVGEAALFNRWTWKDGLNIPKGTNVSLQLVFSEYAKALLKLFGQSDVLYSYSIDPSNFVDFPGMFTIRASMIGTRLVQQRNELHV